MKTQVLIISLVLFALSCSEATSRRQKEKTTSNIVYHKIVINPSLNKFGNDTFKIHRTAIRDKYPSYFFKDNEGICKIENDTLRVFIRQGSLTSTILNLSIVNQTFDTDVWIYDCTSRTQYKPIEQNIQLNKKNFNVGDTLIGQINYKGVLFSDGKFSGTDTLSFDGKFKYLIRPSEYSFEELEKENNYKDFITLAFSEPDSIREVNLWKSGLREIPNEILLFKNLESLSFEDNDLSNADFDILKQLTKLKKLNFRECMLTKIPSSVFSLTHLEEFDIYLNNISEIPNELFTLTNLKALQIGGNNLKTLSPNISRLTKLEWIEFSSTQIKRLPNEMTKLKFLAEIYPNDTMIYIPTKLKPLVASSCNYVTSK